MFLFLRLGYGLRIGWGCKMGLWSFDYWLFLSIAIVCEHVCLD